MSKVRVTHVDDDTIKLGVSGVEVYDDKTGEVHHTATISLKDLEQAVKDAHQEARRSARDVAKSGGDLPVLIHPASVNADSSPRSQDRPPIYISSDTNPMPANPSSEPAEGQNAPSPTFERQPSGLAEVIGNQFEPGDPGPNIVGPPAGVAKGKDTGQAKEPTGQVPTDEHPGPAGAKAPSQSAAAKRSRARRAAKAKATVPANG